MFWQKAAFRGVAAVKKTPEAAAQPPVQQLLSGCLQQCLQRAPDATATLRSAQLVSTYVGQLAAVGCHGVALQWCDALLSELHAKRLVAPYQTQPEDSENTNPATKDAQTLLVQTSVRRVQLAAKSGDREAMQRLPSLAADAADTCSRQLDSQSAAQYYGAVRASLKEAMGWLHKKDGTSDSGRMLLAKIAAEYARLRLREPGNEVSAAIQEFGTFVQAAAAKMKAVDVALAETVGSACKELATQIETGFGGRQPVTAAAERLDVRQRLAAICQVAGATEHAEWMLQTGNDEGYEDGESSAIHRLAAMLAQLRLALSQKKVAVHSAQDALCRAASAAQAAAAAGVKEMNGER